FRPIRRPRGIVGAEIADAPGCACRQANRPQRTGRGKVFEIYSQDLRSGRAKIKKLRYAERRGHKRLLTSRDRDLRQYLRRASGISEVKAVAVRSQWRRRAGQRVPK